MLTLYFTVLLFNLIHHFNEQLHKIKANEIRGIFIVKYRGASYSTLFLRIGFTFFFFFGKKLRFSPRKSKHCFL